MSSFCPKLHHRFVHIPPIMHQGSGTVSEGRIGVDRHHRRKTLLGYKIQEDGSGTGVTGVRFVVTRCKDIHRRYRRVRRRTINVKALPIAVQIPPTHQPSTIPPRTLPITVVDGGWIAINWVKAKAVRPVIHAARYSLSTVFGVHPPHRIRT